MKVNNTSQMKPPHRQGVQKRPSTKSAMKEIVCRYLLRRDELIEEGRVLHGHHAYIPKRAKGELQTLIDAVSREHGLSGITCGSVRVAVTREVQKRARHANAVETCGLDEIAWCSKKGKLHSWPCVRLSSDFNPGGRILLLGQNVVEKINKDDVIIPFSRGMVLWKAYLAVAYMRVFLLPIERSPASDAVAYTEAFRKMVSINDRLGVPGVKQFKDI